MKTGYSKANIKIMERVLDDLCALHNYTNIFEHTQKTLRETREAIEHALINKRAQHSIGAFMP